MCIHTQHIVYKTYVFTLDIMNVYTYIYKIESSKYKTFSNIIL